MPKNNVTVSDYREVLSRCIIVIDDSLKETQYDIGFQRGLEHAMFLLDQLLKEVQKVKVKVIRRK